MKRKRYKQRKKMKISKFQFQEFQKQKDMTETYLQDNVYEVQLNNGFKDRQLLNQAEGKDIDGTEPMSAKALEKSVPTANSNESDKSQNDFPTNSNNWHYLYEEESDSDHRWDSFKKEEEEMHRCDAEREKQCSEKYEEFVDTEPCFPPCTDVTIKLPEKLTAVDKTFIKSKVLEMKMNEERAKEVACYYRDRCSELKGRVLEVQKEQMEYKVQKKIRSDTFGETK